MPILSPNSVNSLKRSSIASVVVVDLGVVVVVGKVEVVVCAAVVVEVVVGG